jgi:uncharacterized protein (TIGR02300 family)
MVASERPAHLKETDLARTDLGDKQACPSCGAKFYDLRKRPAVCPKCSTAFDPADEGVRVKRGRSRVSAEPTYEDEDEEVAAKKAKATGDDEDEEAEEETPEVDTAEVEVLVTDDEEEEATPAGDDLPEGFSETDEDLEDAGAEDDDSVPMLEDEEEFPEDEIGELPGSNDDDDSGR